MYFFRRTTHRAWIYKIRGQVPILLHFCTAAASNLFIIGSFGGWQPGYYLLNYFQIRHEWRASTFEAAWRAAWPGKIVFPPQTRKYCQFLHTHLLFSLLSRTSTPAVRYRLATNCWCDCLRPGVILYTADSMPLSYEFQGWDPWNGPRCYHTLHCIWGDFGGQDFIYMLICN